MTLDIKIIKNYASSLFMQARKLSKEKKVFEDIGFFQEVLNNSKQLKNAMNSPIVAYKEKFKLLNITHDKYNFDQISKQFLYVLIKNSRVNLLSNIISEFESIYRKILGIQLVEVSSYKELKKDEIKFIKDFLESRIGQKIEVKCKLDSLLLGGVVLKYGSNFIDYSILGVLNKIQKLVAK